MPTFYSIKIAYYLHVLQQIAHIISVYFPKNNPFIMLTASFLFDATLLFLDEPTSGLDPATTDFIHEMLLEMKNKGITIFLTTHNMYEASKLCDNIALLNQGEIIEYGNPEE